MVLGRLLFKLKNIMEFSELWIDSYEPEPQGVVDTCSHDLCLLGITVFQGFPALYTPDYMVLFYMHLLSKLAQPPTLPESKEFRQCEGTHLV